MNKYAEAALMVVTDCSGKDSPDIRSAWGNAINTLSVYDEGCPKVAFIGLCLEGMVKGIPANSYGLKRGAKNKRYAVDAAKLLLSGHDMDIPSLWEKVTDKKIVHHGQINIVIRLYQAELLQFPE